MRPSFCARKAGTTEAEKLYAKLLEEREHALGLNSPDLVADLNDLGRVNFAQMKYQQATTYYERALQIMETSKGKQDFAVVGRWKSDASVSDARKISAGGAVCPAGGGGGGANQGPERGGSWRLNWSRWGICCRHRKAVPGSGSSSMIAP